MEPSRESRGSKNNFRPSSIELDVGGLSSGTGMYKSSPKGITTAVSNSIIGAP
jgi:hypothetical protein